MAWPKTRPAVLLAPGTQGAGDQCAPSKLLTQGAKYEMLPATLLLSRGWTAVNTHTPEVDENAHCFYGDIHKVAGLLQQLRCMLLML
ncbi:lipase [Corynebacterium diphtheriae]|nr:lipase [Corynebacterium diphtheriae]CAB0859049.1 lipase [Corynebacterium diphtheriae]